MNNKSPKGYITTEKTVWCGRCNRWQQEPIGTHKQSWKERGWQYTRNQGWLCNVCFKKRTDVLNIPIYKV